MSSHQRLWRYFASALLSCLPTLVCGQSPVVQEIINSVNLDSLTYTVRVLSGEVGSKNNGTSDTIYGRGVYAPGHDLARDYLKGKLESYSFSTELQPFNRWFPGLNVLGTQFGRTTPGKKYILCAHYDDTSPQPLLAPGADDNASGCAAVLEAARLLSHYKPAHTVVYAFWDQEDWGGYGAEKYAQDAAARGDTILGVINLDMIGWDHNGDSVMEIHTNSIAQSAQLSDTVGLVVRLYNLALKPVVYNPGNYSSDHAEFWQAGYSAIHLIEAYWGGDFNPYWHELEDRVSHFNLPYFHSIAKLAIGSAALLAHIEGSASIAPTDPVVHTFSLDQNYPNPFNPSTTIRYELPTRSYVRLAVFNMLGEQVAVLVSSQLEAGSHEARFDAHGLASGVYLYRLSAGNLVQTKKLVLLH